MYICVCICKYIYIYVFCGILFVCFVGSSYDEVYGQVGILELNMGSLCDFSSIGSVGS